MKGFEQHAGICLRVNVVREEGMFDNWFEGDVEVELVVLPWLLGSDRYDG